MSKNAQSNIKQILNSFDNFVKILEDPNWVRIAKADDIKTAFKLGNYLEKTMEHFVSTNSLPEFTNILQKWWNVNSRSKVYSEEFFKQACDKLLGRFFQTENISENALDIAVRVYTSIFPKERMERFLTDLIAKKNSYESIADFINLHSSKNDLQCLKYKVKLQNWTVLIQTCRKDSIQGEISEMLNVYKIETYLHVLIGIMSLNEVSVGEKQVQQIVLKSVLDKMLDRSILSKQFWVTLFKSVNINIVSRTCINFEAFFDSFMNFIIYCGSMMKKENNVWISDPAVSLYPEICYYDILSHINDVIKLKPSLKFAVTDKLKQAREDTGSDIWEKILVEIC